MATLARILILDDEVDTKDLFLQKFRYQIENGAYKFGFVASVEEAKAALKAEEYDIFISDINVAGTDVIGIIGEFRREYPLMRCIVISGYCDISTLRAVMRGGAHDFVIKPIDFKDLADTIQKTAAAIMKLKEGQATAKKLSAIKGELDLSAELQKGILPGNVVKTGEVELYADSIPAAEVGGDFYDYFWLTEKRLGIVMADVSGKNVSAAMFATIAKTLIKSFSVTFDSPAECLAKVNAQICEGNVTTRFVTAIYGIVDLETATLTYANAGHLPVVLIRHDEHPIFLDSDAGIALGIWEGAEFQNSFHKLNPGDMILMYTDGVTEAADAAGEEYDNERFLEALDASRTKSPELITHDLIKSIRGFVNGAMQSDDITTLCLKYRLRIVANVT